MMDKKTKATVADLVLNVGQLRQILDACGDDEAEIHMITYWEPGEGFETAAVVKAYLSSIGPNNDGMPYENGRQVLMLEPFGMEEFQERSMAESSQRSRQDERPI